MKVGTRVEIPAWFDAWMQGDRYGEVVKITTKGSHAYVKLDKSNRTIRVQINSLYRMPVCAHTVKTAEEN